MHTPFFSEETDGGRFEAFLDELFDAPPSDSPDAAAPDAGVEAAEADR